MIYTIFGVSALLFGIGYLITENNARVLLAGYNTMRKEEQDNVDIHAYVAFFRKFHVFLAVSLFVLGASLVYFVSPQAGGISLAVYPLLAYIYYIWKSARLSGETLSRMHLVGMLILAATLALVVWAFVTAPK